jgi:hypothetical protein
MLHSHRCQNLNSYTNNMLGIVYCLKRIGYRPMRCFGVWFKFHLELIVKLHQSIDNLKTGVETGDITSDILNTLQRMNSV